MTEDIQQGTEAWLQARLGRVTASRVADVVAKTKTGVSASRATYMGQLIAERLTGVPQDSYISPAMQHGIDTEAEARAAYEFRQGVSVQQVGFIPHPTIAMSGASPDGLVDTAGAVEIKCPQVSTHIETLLGEKVPKKYYTQIQWQLSCTGRTWCDFVSYQPSLPSRMRMWVCQIIRDDAYIAELEAEVVKFLAELDAQLEALKQKYHE